MTDPLKRAFDAAWGHFGFTLPEEAISTRSPGEILCKGWAVLYQFGSEGGVEFLDAYGMHRMTDDRHVRYYADGRRVSLPAMDEPMLMPFGMTPEEEAEWLRGYRERAEVAARLFEKRWHTRMRALQARLDLWRP
jgi:hypothetical protein